MTFVPLIQFQIQDFKLQENRKEGTIRGLEVGRLSLDLSRETPYTHPGISSGPLEL